jgi:23S rRNA (uracil1939-C5)-methyltransferase
MSKQTDDHKYSPTRNTDSPERIFLIESLAFGGEGIGRELDENQAPIGKKTFIPFSIPGETLEAVITKEEKNLARASIASILTESTDRVDPPCPVFGECGGCQLQHVNLNKQRQLKLEMVKGFFDRQLGKPPTNGVFLLDTGAREYGYRNRLRMKIQRGKLGYFAAGSNDFIHIDQCLLGEDILNDALRLLMKTPKLLPSSATDVLVERNGSGAEVCLYEKRNLLTRYSYNPQKGSLAPAAARTQAYSDEASTVEHFSQVNSEANEVLVDAVISRITEERLIDLYAGAGNFSIPAAQNGQQVDAVELDPALCSIGRTHAEELGISIRFHSLPCEKFTFPQGFTGSVILDPPRRGAADILPALLGSGVQQIIYVSCSLPELCRDLRPIIEKGFVFQEALVVDMFPQTGHVEVVAVLERSSK